MRREASRVLFLMCPFYVRPVLLTLTTNAVTDEFLTEIVVVPR